MASSGKTGSGATGPTGPTGPAAAASGTTYTQTYNTTTTTVPAVTALAATNVGALVLLTDAITAIGTLQTDLNAAKLEIISNRKLIGRLIDDLQAAGISS